MKELYEKPEVGEIALEDWNLLMKIGEECSKHPLPDFKTDGEGQLKEFYKDSHLHGVYPPEEKG